MGGEIVNALVVGSGTSGAGVVANPIVAQIEQLQNVLMT
jgi:hypothetical protein